jgi:hypothetical protein
MMMTNGQHRYLVRRNGTGDTTVCNDGAFRVVPANAGGSGFREAFDRNQFHVIPIIAAVFEKETIYNVVITGY